jgi:hypothetical protein
LPEGARQGRGTEGRLPLRGRARRNNHIIHNSKTGAFYYDIDGAGAHAQIQWRRCHRNCRSAPAISP